MVYGAGGLLVVHDTFEVGTLVALATLLTRLYGPVTALSNVQVDVMTALVSFERVFEVLDMKPSVAEPENPVDLPAGGLSVEFSNVSFRYPGAEATLESLELVPQPEHSVSTQVLSDITFTVQPGQMVALVGPSGAGKTTLTHLVSRLYDPTEGTVRIGGVDLRQVRTQSLRDAVGVVTQDTQLFHDTIRANLRYARPDATDEELIAAMRAAHLDALLETLPEVGHRGRRPRLPSFRRREAAAGHRPAPVEIPVRGGAGRGDSPPGLRVRSRGPAGPGDRAARADLAGHRPPSGHGP